MADIPIVLSFTLTPSELKESLIPYKGQRNLRLRSLRSLFSWTFFLTMLLIWAYFSNQKLPNAINISEPTRYPAGINDLWLTLLPSLVPAFLLAMVLFAALMRIGTINTPHGPRSNTKATKAFTAFFGFTSMIIVGVGVTILMTPSWAIPWSPTRSKIVLVALLPWIALSVFGSMLAPLRLRQTVRNVWKSRPSIGRPKQLQIDHTGIQVIDEFYSSHYSWPYCISYSETENLLRIHLEDKHAILIPKHAGTELQIQSLRVLIHQHIPFGAFLPSSGNFQVILPQPVLEIRE